MLQAYSATGRADVKRGVLHGDIGTTELRGNSTAGGDGRPAIRSRLHRHRTMEQGLPHSRPGNTSDAAAGNSGRTGCERSTDQSSPHKIGSPEVKQHEHVVITIAIAVAAVAAIGASSHARLARQAGGVAVCPGGGGKASRMHSRPRPPELVACLQDTVPGAFPTRRPGGRGVIVRSRARPYGSKVAARSRRRAAADHPEDAEISGRVNEVVGSRGSAARPGRRAVRRGRRGDQWGRRSAGSHLANVQVLQRKARRPEESKDGQGAKSTWDAGGQPPTRAHRLASLGTISLCCDPIDVMRPATGIQLAALMRGTIRRRCTSPPRVVVTKTSWPRSRAARPITESKPSRGERQKRRFIKCASFRVSSRALWVAALNRVAAIGYPAASDGQAPRRPRGCKRTPDGRPSTVIARTSTWSASTSQSRRDGRRRPPREILITARRGPSMSGGRTERRSTTSWSSSRNQRGSSRCGMFRTRTASGANAAAVVLAGRVTTTEVLRARRGAKAGRRKRTHQSFRTRAPPSSRSCAVRLPRSPTRPTRLGCLFTGSAAYKNWVGRHDSQQFPAPTSTTTKGWCSRLSST